MTARWTSGDVPGQHGRVAVVTGANTGLGFEAARVLAARGASVVLAVRDTGKGKAAAARIAGTAPGADVMVQPLDLASLESIRAAAGELRARHPGIDVLINNAGVMFPPRQATGDGFELQLGTNHLGHFALTGLLLEQMLPVPGSRVVTVSSLGHRPGQPLIAAVVRACRAGEVIRSTAVGAREAGTSAGRSWAGSVRLRYAADGSPTHTGSGCVWRGQRGRWVPAPAA